MDTPRIEPKPERSTRPQRLTALDEWLDRGFYWISENAVATLTVLGSVIAAAAVIAGVYEFRVSREESAQTALAAVDRELESAFAPGSEPANPDTARALREKALAGYESVIREHAGRFGAELAVIQAASVEIDLERFDAAEKRLAAAAGSLSEDSLERAVALRMRGYTLERLDRPAEAAEAYAQAAAVEAYPGRAGAYVQAGDTFARLGSTDRAIAQYDALNRIDPGFSERSGVLERLEGLRSGSGVPAAAAAKPTEGAGAPTPAAEPAAKAPEKKPGS